MRFDQRFCARAAVTAGLVATIVSGFGLSPVHAQTTAATPPAQGPVRRLSIDDAVATAIEQNLDLQVQRFNPQLQDLTTEQFKATYTPNFVSTLATSDQTSQSTSFFTGGGIAAGEGVTRGNSQFNVGVNSLTNWFGGSYDVRWNNSRVTTNNPLESFNPQLNTAITATYSQPLLRDFKIDGTRQQLLISQKNQRNLRHPVAAVGLGHRAQRA